MSYIYQVRWEVGAHLPFSREIAPSLLDAIHQGMYCVQIFMGNPKSCTRQQITKEDIASCHTLLNKYPTHVFTHFPYIANLAGASRKDGLAWNNNAQVDKILQTVMKGLEYELSIVAQVGEGVVIHPGSFPDRDLGHETVAKTIEKIQFTPGGMLLLENCAGEGNKLCRTFKEIRRVIDGIKNSNTSHVGVCVDTAHIWGQGDYDLRDIKEVERMFQDFETELGLKRFKLLHLNDSQVKLGSKKDRHAHIATGEIWGDDTASLVYLLDRCSKHKIPVVLETGGPCMLTLSKI